MLGVGFSAGRDALRRPPIEQRDFRLLIEPSANRVYLKEIVSDMGLELGGTSCGSSQSIALFDSI